MNSRHDADRVHCGAYYQEFITIVAPFGGMWPTAEEFDEDQVDAIDMATAAINGGMDDAILTSEQRALFEGMLAKLALLRERILPN
jgi:hypothetical protein